MPLKEWLVALTANKLAMNEEFCDTLITWAYEKAKNATLTNTIIEFSGFGKIYANSKKRDRKLENQRIRLKNLLEENPSNYSEESLKLYNSRVEDTQEFIKYLESKINETKLEPNMGRVEEPTVSLGETEGTHQSDTGR